MIFIIANTSSILFISLFHIFSVNPVQAASKGAVSTSSPEATRAAMDILESGGNAIDAACAAVFVLNVTQPYMTGIGGGGFALVHKVGNPDFFLDFREEAPLSTSPRSFYSSETLQVIKDRKKRITGKTTVGVPGLVAGCGKLVKENGTLAWQKILQPSILRARSGFTISKLFQEELEDHWERMAPFSFSRSLFQGVAGTGLKMGEHLAQPILAETLDKLANEGPESFYTGSLATQWLAEAKEFQIQITDEDLKNYRVIQRELVSFDFGRFHGVTTSAPSGASLMVAAVLRYLDHYFTTHPITSLVTSLVTPLDQSRSQLVQTIATIEAKSFFAQLRNEKITDPRHVDPSKRFIESEF